MKLISRRNKIKMLKRENQRLNTELQVAERKVELLHFIIEELREQVRVGVAQQHEKEVN